jgi:hypothetical protein
MISTQLSLLSTADARLVTICMICKQIIGPGQRPLGTYVAPGIRVSHGVCLTCAPGYCAQCGLSQEDTDRVLAASQPSTP